MNPLTRREGAAYPEEPAPWVDPDYWQQKQEAQQQHYLELPAARARWRLSQLHAAGVHPAEVDFDGGRMTVGPLTPAEYAAAQAVLAGQTRGPDRAARWGMWALLIGVGAAIIAFAPVVLGAGALLAIVGGVLAVCVVAMGLESMTMTRRARLGRRHPDPAIREFARRVWWMPVAGWLIALAVVVAILAAMAMAGGLL